MAALDLNFATGTYSVDGVSYPSLAAVPGYTYARTGSITVTDSDNSIDTFAANVPPINGFGLHNYGALTNSYLQSQAFDNASWTKTNITVTANAATAPDGTATAELLVPTAASVTHVASQGTATAGDTVMFFVKAAGYNYFRIDNSNTDASKLHFDLAAGTIVNTNGVTNGWFTNPFIENVGNGWYRIGATCASATAPKIHPLPTSTASSSFLGDGVSGTYVWQGSSFGGANLPNGGPILPTTTASVSIGAAALAVSCVNDNYVATYTFDDSSTQNVNVTIAGGLFTLATHPAVLNRTRVARVQLNTADNAISKLGVAGVIRQPAANILTKFGVAGVIRQPAANILTKAAMVAVMRTSARNEISKASIVAVLRAPPGYTLAVDSGVYAIAGSPATLRVGRLLHAYDNLILNGTVAQFVDDWVVTGADTTLQSVEDRGLLTLGSAASGGYTWQSVSVAPGKTYQLSAFLKPVTPTGASHVGVKIGITQGGQGLGFAEVATGTGSTRTVNFIGPSSGVVYVSIYTSATHDCAGVFGDVVLQDTAAYHLTGTPVVLTKTDFLMSTGAGTYTMAGSDAILRISRRVAAVPGVYNHIGADARVLVGRAIVAAPGSYTITPTDASISYIQGRFIHLERGALALTGGDARLIYGRSMPLGSATFALTGTAAAWIYQRAIVAAPATYALNGAGAGLRVGYRLAAQPGDYALTGTDAALVNRRLTAQSGAYVAAGSTARLLHSKRLAAAPGVLHVTGTPALLLSGRRMSLSAATYTITGSSVGARIGRSLSASGGVYALSGAAARVVRGYTVHALPGAYALTGATINQVAARRLLLTSGSLRMAWPDVGLTYLRTPPGPRAISPGFAASRYLSVPPQSRYLSVPPQDRKVSAEPVDQRYAAVAPLEHAV